MILCTGLGFQRADGLVSYVNVYWMSLRQLAEISIFRLSSDKYASDSDIEDEAAALILLLQGLVFLVCNRRKNFDWILVQKPNKMLRLDNGVLVPVSVPRQTKPHLWDSRNWASIDNGSINTSNLAWNTQIQNAHGWSHWALCPLALFYFAMPSISFCRRHSSISPAWARLFFREKSFHGQMDWGIWGILEEANAVSKSSWCFSQARMILPSKPWSQGYGCQSFWSTFTKDGLRRPFTWTSFYEATYFTRDAPAQRGRSRTFIAVNANRLWEAHGIRLPGLCFCTISIHEKWWPRSHTEKHHMMHQYIQVRASSKGSAHYLRIPYMRSIHKPQLDSTDNTRWRSSQCVFPSAHPHIAKHVRGIDGKHLFFHCSGFMYIHMQSARPSFSYLFILVKTTWVWQKGWPVCTTHLDAREYEYGILQSTETWDLARIPGFLYVATWCHQQNRSTTSC